MCLAMDLPGFGRTERNGRRGRVSDLRGTVSGSSTRSRAGGPVVLVGNSMGGADPRCSRPRSSRPPVEALCALELGLPVEARLVAAGAGRDGRLRALRAPRVGEWASRQRVTRLEAERAVELGLRIIAADPSAIPEDPRPAATSSSSSATSRTPTPDRRSPEASARSLLVARPAAASSCGGSSGR